MKTSTFSLHGFRVALVFIFYASSTGLLAILAPLSLLARLAGVFGPLAAAVRVVVIGRHVIVSVSWAVDFFEGGAPAERVERAIRSRIGKKLGEVEQQVEMFEC